MTKGLLLAAVAGLAALALLADRPAATAAGDQVEAVAEPASKAPPSAPIENFAGSVTLNRAADSHFYADAQVNGARVRFIVDTGATGVVLTQADAQRAGIADGDYSAAGVGAGGMVRLMPVTLDRIAIGSLSAHNVPAHVAEDGLPVSLLGQSWLARLGSVTIANDEMVLR